MLVLGQVWDLTKDEGSVVRLVPALSFYHSSSTPLHVLRDTPLPDFLTIF